MANDGSKWMAVLGVASCIGLDRDRWDGSYRSNEVRRWCSIWWVLHTINGTVSRMVHKGGWVVDTTTLSRYAVGVVQDRWSKLRRRRSSIKAPRARSMIRIRIGRLATIVAVVSVASAIATFWSCRLHFANLSLHLEAPNEVHGILGVSAFVPHHQQSTTNHLKIDNQE